MKDEPTHPLPLSALPDKPLEIQRRGILDPDGRPRALVGPGTGLHDGGPARKAGICLEAVRDGEIPDLPVRVGARGEGVRRRAGSEVDGGRPFVVLDGAVGWVQARPRATLSLVFFPFMSAINNHNAIIHT